MIFLYQIEEPLSNICILKGGTAFDTEQVCEISTHSYVVAAHCFQSKLNEPQAPNKFINWSLTLPAGPERFVIPKSLFPFKCYRSLNMQGEQEQRLTVHESDTPATHCNNFRGLASLGSLQNESFVFNQLPKKPAAVSSIVL